MKNYILIIIIFLSIQVGFSQINLVPNPSFEMYSICPNTTAQIGYAVPWFSPLYPGSTSDYYNACDLTNYASVPIQGGTNFQYARTGNAIAGIGLYDETTYREYFEIKLFDSLVSGKTYCVSYYVNLGNFATWGIDGFGAYFSNDSILTATPVIILSTPQIENISGNIISDTLNWIKVSGSFTASGGEQFLTIGNFIPNNSLHIDTLNYGSALAYYFIDDVSVYPCDAPVYIAEAGSNQTICIGKPDSVQIGSTSQSEYIYWWTPTTGLSNANIANPKASPAVTTTYYLHQKDFKFDETIDSVTVVVKTNCDTASVDDIFVPTAFSPNGDLNNDVLYVRSHSIKDMKFCIYNRWGEKVFESKDLNVGWDGTYKNDACNTGVYVWSLSATLKDGTLLTKKGDVTLFR